MKKYLLIAVMLLMLIPQNAFAAPVDIKGSGTPEEPYIIYTANGLDQVRNDLSATYKLGADIDLSGYSNWAPIGNDSAQFSGIFDGSNYKIGNLTINYIEAGLDYGLFGNVGLNGQIKNTHLENVNIKGDYYVGALAGINSGTITNSSVTGSVTGNEAVGGLVGSNRGKIATSSSTATVSSTVGSAGGIAGENDGEISNTYSTGSTAAVIRSGGFVAYNVGTITNCYSTGTVVGEFTGGLVNGNFGTVTNSYYSESTGQTDTGKGTLLTDTQMRQRALFVGWDFTNIWSIEDGVSYPTLVFLTSANVIDLVIGLNKLNNNVFIISNRAVENYDLSQALPLGYETLAGMQ